MSKTEELDSAIGYLLEGACEMEDAIDDIREMPEKDLDMACKKISDIISVLVQCQRRIKLVEFEDPEEHYKEMSIKAASEDKDGLGRDYS